MGILQTLGIVADDPISDTPLKAGISPSQVARSMGDQMAGSSAPIMQTPAFQAQVLTPASSFPGVSDPAKASKYAQNLEKALADANLPGVDFFEFQKNIQALENVMAGSDERMRYSAAFATLAVSMARPSSGCRAR